MCDRNIDIDSLTFVELNEHTPAAEIPAMLWSLEEGSDVGGISEAGCPSSSFHGTSIGPQSTGTISLLLDESTFSFTNDILGDNQDRWRTTSAELSIGNFSIGSYVDTNHGKAESNYLVDRLKNHPDRSIEISDRDSNGNWIKGRALSSPIWVGYNKHGLVNRVGISHPHVQNLTQNFVHKHIGTPTFGHYDYFQKGGYSYIGTINPYTLWMY